MKKNNRPAGPPVFNVKLGLVGRFDVVHDVSVLSIMGHQYFRMIEARLSVAPHLSFKPGRHRYRFERFVWRCAANRSGSMMGKMIDAQSIALTRLMGTLVTLQAYVFPFRRRVAH